jgi:hypothetical protein
LQSLFKPKIAIISTNEDLKMTEIENKPEKSSLDESSNLSSPTINGSHQLKG